MVATGWHHVAIDRRLPKIGHLVVIAGRLPKIGLRPFCLALELGVQPRRMLGAVLRRWALLASCLTHLYTEPTIASIDARNNFLESWAKAAPCFIPVVQVFTQAIGQSPFFVNHPLAFSLVYKHSVAADLHWEIPYVMTLLLREYAIIIRRYGDGGGDRHSAMTITNCARLLNFTSPAYTL